MAIPFQKNILNQPLLLGPISESAVMSIYSFLSSLAMRAVALRSDDSLSRSLYILTIHVKCDIFFLAVVSLIFFIVSSLVGPPLPAVR